MKKFFDVEKILEKDESNGYPLYLIKWLGYPLSEATWEPKSNLLNVKYMIEEFEANRKKNKYKEFNSETCEKKEDFKKTSNEFRGNKKIETDILKDNCHNQLIDIDIKNLFYPNPKIDVALQIIDTLKVNHLVYFEIKWKARPDGIEPYNTTMTFQQVKEKYPYLLIEYLESKNINLY